MTGIRDSRMTRSIRPLPPARHDHVHVLVEREQVSHGGAVRRRHELHGVRGQRGSLERRADRVGDRPVRPERLGAAPQDARVAGLQAQARGIRRDVGPRLVDDPDDAEGDPHPPDLETGRTVVEFADRPDRVGQRRHLPHALAHAVDGAVVEHQAIDQRAVHAALDRPGDILSVGGPERLPVRVEAVRDRAQRIHFRPGGGAGEQPRRGARAPPHVLHRGPYVHGHGLYPGMHADPRQPRSLLTRRRISVRRSRGRCICRSPCLISGENGSMSDNRQLTARASSRSISPPQRSVIIG